MANPMTPDQWLAALRREGVTDIVEMPGWRTNNRDHIKAFTDVHAAMVHHTAGEGPGLPSLLFNGRADLPGPLCHDYLTRTGRLYLVGNGRANHAGTVARNAYNAVLNEQAIHPYPDAAEPIDGNDISYGLECENSGVEGRAWTSKQYDVAVRVQAARCRFHGWTENSVWAHKEATRRKPVDPRLPMDQFRADVAERLAHEPGWNPNQEDDMAITDADAEKIARKVLTLDAITAPPDAPDVKTNPTWRLDSYEKDTNSRVRGLEKKLALLAASNDKLVGAVATLAAGIGDLDPEAIIAELRSELENINIRLDVPDA